MIYGSCCEILPNCIRSDYCHWLADGCYGHPDRERSCLSGVGRSQYHELGVSDWRWTDHAALGMVGLHFPGVAILITVLAINLVGEGLNDALNPRLRRELTEKLLQIQNLFIELPAGSERQNAVQDLSLELAPGETLCVVGEVGLANLRRAVMGLYGTTCPRF